MRRYANFVSYGCAAVLGFLLLQGAATSLQKDLASATPRLSFAQITDTHLFDDGFKDPPPDPVWYLVEDQVALRWAIDEINKRADRTEFVVYTGDFGLENVFFESKECNPHKLEEWKNGLPQFRFDIAAQIAAREFARLQVQSLYVVAGNNDLVDEQANDYHRFECFVQEMQKVLKAIGSTLNLQILTPDKPVPIRGFRLAGLNTASFKKEGNFSAECAKPQNSNSQGCPGSQLRMLETSLMADTTPLLLFTHVPDLKDPKSNNSSWDIGGLRSQWLKLASQSQFGGIFAGHFHSPRTELYGTNTGTKQLFEDPIDGDKTWVAPPLAGKYQRDAGNQARGLMWVTVESDNGKLSVKADPDWYEERNPAQGTGATRTGDAGPGSGEKKGAAPMSQQWFSVLVCGVMVATGLFGGWLNFLLNKKSEDGKLEGRKTTGATRIDPSETVGAANFVLGVGAAFLIPLFLRAIGSNLVHEMHYGDSGNPLYSEIFVFAGYCLVASMSSRVFIESVSGRVLKQTARDTKQVAEDTLRKLDATQRDIMGMRDQVDSRLQALERKIEPPDSDRSNQ